MKTCTKCLQEKEAEEFAKDKQKKDGLRSSCRECSKSYHNKTKDQFRERKNARMREYSRENKDVISKKAKKYYSENKEMYARKSKIWRDDNVEEISKSKKKYYEANKSDIKKNTAARTVKKRKESESFRTLERLRNRLYYVIRKGYFSKETERLLGCNGEQFIKHISDRFTEGMAWDMHGRYGWHIDHIKPCSSFDFSNESEILKCFHYTNLQPLWAADNLKKGCKGIFKL